MISICIPIYNFDVRPLVADLHIQACAVLRDFEIILIDDGSKEEFKIFNRDCQVLDKIIYHELDKNIGRSKIRNLLAKKSRFSKILFLDCDLQIISNSFILNYLNQSVYNDVICGGHIYQKNKPALPHLLHWKYGRIREVTDFRTRNQTPYSSFMTGNFMVSKNLFKALRFDERFNTYGHEDTLFGYELQKLGVKIQHINNPAEHTGLDENREFLRKTRESVNNLLFIYREKKYDQEFVNSVKLLKTYQKVKSWKLSGLIGSGFVLFRKRLEKNLTGKHPRIIFLDFYKLGYMCIHKEPVTFDPKLVTPKVFRDSEL